MGLKLEWRQGTGWAQCTCGICKISIAKTPHSNWIWTIWDITLPKGQYSNVRVSCQWPLRTCKAAKAEAVNVAAMVATWGEE